MGKELSGGQRFFFFVDAALFVRKLHERSGFIYVFEVFDLCFIVFEEVFAVLIEFLL